ncbi:MAG: hypothetical protein AB7T49_00665 [Oligoflexales bacterium]
MKYFKIVMFLIGMSVLTQGCYRKWLLFQAESVSMTASDSGKKKLVAGKEISEKWCVADKPVVDSDQSPVGMVDQVIYKAQDGGKKADFIMGARIYVDSKNCAFVEGKLAKAKGKEK